MMNIGMRDNRVKYWACGGREVRAVDECGVISSDRAWIMVSCVGQ